MFSAFHAPAESTHLPSQMGPSPLPLPLENTGVAVTMSVFRLGYFYGGDGCAQLKVDLRNAAGFVRHPTACITNFLLPVKVCVRERPPFQL